jgi:hypothetical protein
LSGELGAAVADNGRGGAIIPATIERFLQAKEGVTAARSRAGDPADLACSVAPLALIVLAAAVPIARPFALAGLVWVAVAVRRDAPVRWPWAAPIPVAVSLRWALLPVPAVSVGRRLLITSPTAAAGGRAGVVIGAVAIGLGVRARPEDRRTCCCACRRAVVLVDRRFLVAGRSRCSPARSARPFFGEITYDVTMVGAIAQLLFAVANGSMEIAYRGACSAGRHAGPVPAAVVGQASCSGWRIRART